ncbi:DNA/RNA non-specific endonuclease [Pseudonocardia sp. MH-G8]|uniref:DNA/RNA non-specific endonuclease n=1 Tax=Pseudonocardia sp. MH-G8 TaxID=1854588 RepID=UPI000BA07BE6|nr:DNA/RNA non-specific endonuclease [Pseudonocardia sp. MH-G8]OZM75665.1 hypothetical protein CFP66_45135 [Pseudonocardia sp. MH-G8]
MVQLAEVVDAVVGGDAHRNVYALELVAPNGDTLSTCVYPNAAPQAADLNQVKQLWLGLEGYTLTYADTNDIQVECLHRSGPG